MIKEQNMLDVYDMIEGYRSEHCIPNLLFVTLVKRILMVPNVINAGTSQYEKRKPARA